MALRTVKIKLMAVRSPDMKMKVVTVKVAVEPLAVAVKPVQTVSLILPLMAVNVVILPGMSLV